MKRVDKRRMEDPRGVWCKKEFQEETGEELVKVGWIYVGRMEGERQTKIVGALRVKEKRKTATEMAGLGSERGMEKQSGLYRRTGNGWSRNGTTDGRTKQNKIDDQYGSQSHPDFKAIKKSNIY